MSTCSATYEGCCGDVECEVDYTPHPNQPHVAVLEHRDEGHSEGYIHAFVGWWDAAIPEVEDIDG